MALHTVNYTKHNRHMASSHLFSSLKPALFQAREVFTYPDQHRQKPCEFIGIHDMIVNIPMNS